MGDRDCMSSSSPLLSLAARLSIQISNALASYNAPCGCSALFRRFLRVPRLDVFLADALFSSPFNKLATDSLREGLK